MRVLLSIMGERPTQLQNGGAHVETHYNVTSILQVRQSSEGGSPTFLQTGCGESLQKSSHPSPLNFWSSIYYSKRGCVNLPSKKVFESLSYLNVSLP